MPISSRCLLRRRSAEQQPKRVVMELEPSPSLPKPSLIPDLEPVSDDSSRSDSDDSLCYSSSSSCLSTATASLTQVGGPLRRTVRFAKVEIQSYEIVVGDHPCCQTGCPLQLGWNTLGKQRSVDLDDYETERASLRRSHQELRMGADERRERLLDSCQCVLDNCSNKNANVVVQEPLQQQPQEQQQQEPQDTPTQPPQSEQQRHHLLRQREGEIRHACRLQQRRRDRRLRRADHNLFFQATKAQSADV